VVVTGYTSGATYNPTDTASHTYVVRAVEGTCTTDSTGSAFADASSAPGAPSITSITDVDPCAQSGIQVSYTAGSGATSHNLLKDGSVVVTGYTSGATYNPTDTASHTYVVRAVEGSCSTDSTGSAFADASHPASPTIAGASSNSCPTTTVDLSTETGMSSYQWYVGGTPIGGAQSNVYTVTATGSYTVSYTNGFGCSGLSSAHAVTINSCDPPPETAPGNTISTAQTWTNKTTHTWAANGQATLGYNVYRGMKADLPQLMNSSDDSCTKYLEISDNFCPISDDPTGIAGGFYWYLVTGVNGNGEGSAGNATAGPRIVNSTGTCP
jgi:hypothetical protein